MTIPGKVQSYLGAGVPIVAMLDGEGARVIEESSAGLVCSAGDSEGLASAILRLASLSDEERAAMGRRGASYAKREFDRDELISRFEGALAETLAAKAGCPGTAGNGSAQGTTTAGSDAPDT